MKSDQIRIAPHFKETLMSDFYYYTIISRSILLTFKFNEMKNQQVKKMQKKDNMTGILNTGQQKNTSVLRYHIVEPW